MVGYADLHKGPCWHGNSLGGRLALFGAHDAVNVRLWCRNAMEPKLGKPEWSQETVSS